MILRVVSDGLGKTTYFEDVETGQPITFEGVRGVSWEQRRNAAILTVEFYTFEIQAKGVPKLRSFNEPDEPIHRDIT